MPVFNGSDVVGETLDDVLAQTVIGECHVEVLIGLEPTSDANATKALIQERRKFERPPVLTLSTFEHKERLGWSRNVNFLYGVASGDFVAILPHDDRVPKDYHKRLLDCLRAHPLAVNCFPKLVMFGTRTGVLRQPSIRGSPHERVMAAIDTWVGASFRGLVRWDRRRGVDTHPLLLHPLAGDFFSTDMLQLVATATLGELIEVDLEYRKRYRESSVHTSQMRWQVLPRDDLATAEAQLNALKYNVGRMFVNSSNLFQAKVAGRVRYMLGHWGLSATQTASAMHLFARMIREPKRAIVLGAGLQGCLVALQLQRRGWDVTLMEQESDVMTRAATKNEGKVHLGFVYSKDNSLRTADVMLEHALHFANDVEEALGERVDWDALKSTPFAYSCRTRRFCRPPN